MHRLREVERLDELGEVVGVGVEIVALPGLTRAAMAAAVMGDAPVAMRDQKKHLVFKGVRAQRPTMAEDDGLPRAPVFVVNLGAVLGGDWVLSQFLFEVI